VLHEFHVAGEVGEDELEKEYRKAFKSVEELEFKKMLSGEEDQLSAMVEINPGAGGTESQDWADMLNRMYIMWGEKMVLRLHRSIISRVRLQGLNRLPWK